MPCYEGKGYGSYLMDFCENQILKGYESIVLDSSLPAQEMYKKRGYQPIEYHKVLCDNGDYLCYYTMKLGNEIKIKEQL